MTKEAKGKCYEVVIQTQTIEGESDLKLSMFKYGRQRAGAAAEAFRCLVGKVVTKVSLRACKQGREKRIKPR